MDAVHPKLLLSQDSSIPTPTSAMQIAVDVNLSYQLVPDKVPSFYVKFRSDDLSIFTNTYMHNVARDEIARRTTENFFRLFRKTKP